jgi:hypothetical protein
VLAYVLVSFAAAADLEIHLNVPGVEPVWTTIHDVAPGATHELAVAGRHGHTYRLKTDVMAGDGPDMWRVAFDLTGRKGHRVPDLLAAPTMQAHAGELAQFAVGKTVPVTGTDDVYMFHGATIDWVVNVDTK